LIGDVQPDVVIHLASPVVTRWDTPIDELRAGILDAAVAVAGACAAVDARLVHVGSCAEYGQVSSPHRESQMRKPIMPYGVLKAAATDWVMAMVATGQLSGLVVRPFRVYGPFGQAGLVGEAMRSALGGKRLAMTDGQQVREWNHVDAMAWGLVALAAHPESVGSIINLGGGPKASLESVVRMIFTLAGQEQERIDLGALERPLGDVESIVGNHEHATALIGNLPHLSLEEGLRDTMDWFRAKEAS